MSPTFNMIGYLFVLSSLWCIAFSVHLNDYREQPNTTARYIKNPQTQRLMLNPDYIDPKSQQNPVYKVADSTTALAIVSNFEQMEEYAAAGGEAVMPEYLQDDVMMLQDAETSALVGSNPGKILDGVFDKFTRYEIPMGMLNKLLELRNYEYLCFLVDDSGSMGLNVHDPTKEMSQLAMELGQGRATRWIEACSQILTMLDVLMYIPKGTIDIHFLNRPDKLSLTQKEQSPEQFYEYAKKKIITLFSIAPRGTTPMYDRMCKVMSQYGPNVAFYIFCDGVPDGGKYEIEKITKMVMNRENPETRPITFVSCSDNEKEVEWMKQVEEAAPYCSEMDDFKEEQKEIIKDQGNIFPYSWGVYLCCLIVGAINPHDLDALDESIPMTKFTLDSVLGMKHPDEIYEAYFNEVINAQRKKGIDLSDLHSLLETFRTYEGVASSLNCYEGLKKYVVEANKIIGESHRLPYGYPPYKCNPADAQASSTAFNNHQSYSGTQYQQPGTSSYQHNFAAGNYQNVPNQGYMGGSHMSGSSQGYPSGTQHQSYSSSSSSYFLPNDYSMGGQRQGTNPFGSSYSSSGSYLPNNAQSGQSSYSGSSNNRFR